MEKKAARLIQERREKDVSTCWELEAEQKHPLPNCPMKQSFTASKHETTARDDQEVEPGGN